MHSEGSHFLISMWLLHNIMCMLLSTRYNVTISGPVLFIEMDVDIYRAKLWRVTIGAFIVNVGRVRSVK